MKKILSIILGITMIITSITIMPDNVNAAAIGKVTLTIEKLSIGQGLFVEPTQITIQNGDTVEKVIDRYMRDHSLSYVCSTQNGWYLTSIDNADKIGVAKIPNEIANIDEPYEFKYIDDNNLIHKAQPIYAPNTNQNLGNDDKNLNEGDYNVMSGWVFTVNNNAVFSGKSFNREDGLTSTNPTVRNIYKSAAQVKVKNGDVVRVMFTVFGYGADVGIDTKRETDISKVELVDKTDLLRAIGDVNSSKSYWMVYPNVNKAYNQALKIAKTYNPSKESVGKAVTSLKAAVKSPEKPTVGQVKIKSAKNLKGKKIRITMTKKAGVAGFQIKYGNNRKLKNKKKRKWKTMTIKTTKTIYTTKKIADIKKKKAYVKIRGYRKVNGTYVYGNWTKVRKVKINK